MTEMLVELLFSPLTFCGAPSGSDEKKKVNQVYLICKESD